MAGDAVFRRIVILTIMGELFEGKCGESSFIFKINDDITSLIAGLHMGIKREGELSRDLIHKVHSNSSEEAKRLMDHLMKETQVFDEKQADREVQAMLWIALEEVHNRFRLGGKHG